MQTDRSIPELTRDVAFHLGDMFRNEMKLAKVEATESVKSLSGGVGLILTGAVVGVSALTVGLIAIAYGLAQTMPMWSAAAIVAVVAAIFALILVSAGKAALKAKGLSLPRTREQMSRDLKTISERVH
jgi:hypothetical protein